VTKRERGRLQRDGGALIVGWGRDKERVSKTIVTSGGPKIGIVVPQAEIRWFCWFSFI